MEKEKQKEEKETETKNETGNENEKKEKENNSEEVTGTKETEQDKQAIVLRHLNMDDMRQAKNQVNIYVSLNFDMQVDFIYTDFFVGHVGSFFFIFCSQRLTRISSMSFFYVENVIFE